MNDRLEEKLTVREAARRRQPLSGTDAEALEGALSQAERELESARAEIEQMKRDQTGIFRCAILTLNTLQNEMEKVTIFLNTTVRAFEESCAALEGMSANHGHTSLAAADERVRELVELAEMVAQERCGHITPEPETCNVCHAAAILDKHGKE